MTTGKYLRTENAKWPASLVDVPREQWPSVDPDPKRIRLLRSRRFLVQVFAERDGVLRLSVIRTWLDADEFADGISWDELQGLKRQAGYGDRYAIEIYPREDDIVNVSNMRHLWVLPDPLEIGWFKEKNS